MHNHISAHSKEPQNILEWLSARAIPDSSITLLIGLVSAMTLAPYLGGRTIWFVGSSAVTIPTADESWIWFLAFTSPFLWVLLVGLLIHTTIRRTLGALVGAAIFAFVLGVVLNRYPAIILSAVTPNFNQRYRLEFLEVQHTWDIGRKLENPPAPAYCAFRTAPLALGELVRRGCALRIDKVDVEANGMTRLQAQDAFDLWVYVSTRTLLSPFDECVDADHWQTVASQPQNPEVEGGVVVGVTPEIVAVPQAVQYLASYDFGTSRADARPVRIWEKALTRDDIYVNSRAPTLQVSAWTLSGTSSDIHLHSLAVRVLGRLVCGFWF